MNLRLWRGLFKRPTSQAPRKSSPPATKMHLALTRRPSTPAHRLFPDCSVKNRPTRLKARAARRRQSKAARHARRHNRVL